MLCHVTATKREKSKNESDILANQNSEWRRIRFFTISKDTYALSDIFCSEREKTVPFLDGAEIGLDFVFAFPMFDHVPLEIVLLVMMAESPSVELDNDMDLIVAILEKLSK